MRPRRASPWAPCSTGQGQPDDAVTSYLEAIRLRPSYPEAWCNLGAVRQDQHAFDEAAAALAEALRLRPTMPRRTITRFAATGARPGGRGAGLLPARSGACAGRRRRPLERGAAAADQGDFPAGWAKYEWRWRRKGNAPRPLPMPPWQGEPLAGAPFCSRRTGLRRHDPVRALR